MVRSYVKIYGPPIMKAIRALEGVAVDLNKTAEVTFSHKCVPYPRYTQQDQRDWQSYLTTLKRTYVDCYEPARMISEAHEMLGENDFFFEWKDPPTKRQLENLIAKIDDVLTGLGCNYTIKTI
jgi:hypothetical protein